MRWKEIIESASAGATGAASIATAVKPLGGNSQALGVGFDPNGDQGVYQSSKKKKPLLIRR